LADTCPTCEVDSEMSLGNPIPSNLGCQSNWIPLALLTLTSMYYGLTI